MIPEHCPDGWIHDGEATAISLLLRNSTLSTFKNNRLYKNLSTAGKSICEKLFRTEDLLRKVPTLPQRQDSLSEQLEDLFYIANKLGMYDAADWILASKHNPYVK